MKGDFTRNTFDPRNHFSRVLMQQGRVQLDADWNEQAAILLHYLRTLAADLIGPHGGPGKGFRIVKQVDEEDNKVKRDFEISPGRYYVDGILCENNAELAYTDQPNYPLPQTEQLKPNQDYLVYLDVWERHISYVQDDSLREVALGGPDTASRAKVVWQVKTLQLNDNAGENGGDAKELNRFLTELKVTLQNKAGKQVSILNFIDEEFPNNVGDVEELEEALHDFRAKFNDIAKESEDIKGVVIESIKSVLNKAIENIEEMKVKGNGVPTTTRCAELVDDLRGRPKPLLQARADVEGPPKELCITPPEARYRGAENQLYRVEIHTGGSMIDNEPTFKWSHDNGSVVFPIRKLATGEGETTVTVAHLGRDSRFGLRVGDWVEIVDDDYVLQGRAEPLLKVNHVDRVEGHVILAGTPDSQVGQNLNSHPLLRRWDHEGDPPAKASGRRPQPADDGTLLVEEDKWLDLEDGVQIYFESASTGAENSEGNRKSYYYRTGDYWLIPARTATGDVEWPQGIDDDGKRAPKALEPHGIAHHYAPLAIISVAGQGTVTVNDEGCRRSFESGFSD